MLFIVNFDFDTEMIFCDIMLFSLKADIWLRLKSNGRWKSSWEESAKFTGLSKSRQTAKNNNCFLMRNQKMRKLWKKAFLVTYFYFADKTIQIIWIGNWLTMIFCANNFVWIKSWVNPVFQMNCFIYIKKS